MRRIVRIGRRTGPYVVLDKGIDDDPRLSYRAKGIHRRWMGMPDDWQLNVAEFCQHAIEGPDAIRAAIRELRRFGYAECWQARDHQGKVIAHEWFVYEAPDPTKCPRLVPKDQTRGLFVRWICLDAAVNSTARQSMVSEPPTDPRFHATKPETVLPDLVLPDTANPPVLINERTKYPNQRSMETFDRNVENVSLKKPPSGQPPPGRRRMRFGAVLPGELTCLRRLMMEFGFAQHDADGLILEHGPRRALTAIRNANFQAMSGRQPRGRNGWRGYIVAAMQKGYTLIEGVRLVENEDEQLAIGWEQRMVPTGAVLKRPDRPADSSAEKARQLAALRAMS